MAGRPSRGAGPRARRRSRRGARTGVRGAPLVALACSAAASSGSRAAVLPSPNGSAIAAATSGLVIAACLRNATAVAGWLRRHGYGTERPLCVVPAGERWPDGSLRPALEDLLGAGAVLAALDGPGAALSPESAAARALFASLAGPSLARSVRDCASAQELLLSGYAEDVEVARELDAAEVVPVLQDGCFRPAPDGSS